MTGMIPPGISRAMHQKGIHTLRILVLSAFLLLSQLTFAQKCGTHIIQKASELYANGNFRGAKDTLLFYNCLEDDDLGPDDRVSAYKLLIRMHLLLDEYDEATDAIKKLLSIDPTFSPNKNDESILFVEMVNDLRKPPESNSLDEMVLSASRREQRASEAPASIYVVNRKEIEMRGYSNLLELLEDVPAVEVQRNSTNEFRNIVSFRGISGNEKFIVMIDGIRVTPASGDPYVLGTNFSLVNAKRVEVILGPASALYGVDAFSGIINIYTRDGEDLHGGSVSGSFGQFNTTDNSFIFGAKKQGVEMSFSGNYYRTDEAPLNSLFEEEYSWYNEQYKPNDLMLSAAGDTIKTPVTYDRTFRMPTSSYFVSGKVTFGDFEIGATRFNESHSSSMSVDPSLSIYTSDAYLSTTMQSLYCKHIHSFELKNPNSSFILQTLYSLTHFEMSPESGFVNRFTDYEKGYKYQFSKSQKLEEQIEYVVNNKFDIVGGVSYELLGALPKTADAESPFDKRIPTSEQGNYYSGSDAAGDSIAIPLDYYFLNFWNFGSYLQMRYAVNPKVDLTLGSRYDYNSRYDGSVNPRVGLVVKATEDIRVKMLYGKAFLAPSPWKSYLSYGSFYPVTSGNTTTLRSAFYHVPNSDLRPEKLQSVEASVTWLNGTQSRLDVGAYYNAIDDLISLQEADQSQDSFKGVPVSYVETSANLGESVTYGFNIRYIQRLVDTKSQTLNAYCSYDYSSGHISVFQSDGSFEERDLTLSAPHTVKAGVDFQYSSFSGNLGILHRTRSKSVKTLRPESYTGSPATSLNESKHQPFTVLDLYLKYKIKDMGASRWHAFVKVRNLFNAKYYHVAGATDSFNATPQDPIRVNVGVKLEL